MAKHVRCKNSRRVHADRSQIQVYRTPQSRSANKYRIGIGLALYSATFVVFLTFYSQLLSGLNFLARYGMSSLLAFLMSWLVMITAKKCSNIISG